MKVTVAITGASGTIYAQRLIEELSRHDEVETIYVVMTKNANDVARYEIGDDWGEFLGYKASVPDSEKGSIADFEKGSIAESEKRSVAESEKRSVAESERGSVGIAIEGADSTKNGDIVKGISDFFRKGLDSIRGVAESAAKRSDSTKKGIDSIYENPDSVVIKSDSIGKGADSIDENPDSQEESAEIFGGEGFATKYAASMIRRIEAKVENVESSGYKGDVSEHGSKYIDVGKIIVYDNSDFFTPIASGSASSDAMVIVPCSMGMVGRIANGISDDLISRAADVMIKERLPLIVVPRESPMSLIHLRNMVSLAEAGVVVMPAAPSFYHKPETIEELVNSIVERIIKQLKISKTDSYKWKG